MKIRDVIGRTVSGLRLGRWKARAGVELPGLAGPTWHYADAFVCLEDGAVLRLACAETEVLSRLPRGARRSGLPAGDEAACVGARIVDVLEGDEPFVIVWLDNGRCLDYQYLPGGSRLSVGKAAAWATAGLPGECGPLRSLATGLPVARGELAGSPPPLRPPAAW